MSEALVVYASKHGSTRQIAEALGKRLTEKGFPARIEPTQATRDERARVPVAVFGSGPRTDENGAWKHSRRQLDRALAHFPGCRR